MKVLLMRISQRRVSSRIQATGICLNLLLGLPAALLAVEATPADSTAPTWDKTLVSGIHFSQVGFSNWQKGGDDALAWMFTVMGDFKRHWQSSMLRTHGKIEYGQTRLKESGTRTAQNEIFLETISQGKNKHVNIYGSVRTETQLSVGYNYDVEPAVPQTDFADPIYFYESIGGIYSEHENFTTRLGLSLKQTYTTRYPKWADDPTTPEIEKTRYEHGLESVTELQYTLMQNLLLKGTLRLFSALSSVKETDVDLNTQITAQVNKYVDVNMTYRLLYDWDVSKRAQMAEGITIGLTFTLL